MNRLRAATEEEVNKIKESSDLDAGCLVLALDTNSGTGLAVIRTAVELDPVYFPEQWNTKSRAFFIRDIETFLSAKGAPSYYFNVAVDNTEWQENVKSWGAEQVSKSPEFRMKRNL